MRITLPVVGTIFFLGVGGVVLLMVLLTVFLKDNTYVYPFVPFALAVILLMLLILLIFILSLLWDQRRKVRMARAFNRLMPRYDPETMTPMSLAAKLGIDTRGNDGTGWWLLFIFYSVANSNDKHGGRSVEEVDVMREQ